MNPLLLPSPLEFGFPDFDAIREEHFTEAFKVAMAEQRAEVAAITALPGAPTFDDTVVALERSGATLRRVSAVFFVLVGSLSTPGIRETEAMVAPLLAAHADAITLDPPCSPGWTRCTPSATSWAWTPSRCACWNAGTAKRSGPARGSPPRRRSGCARSTPSCRSCPPRSAPGCWPTPTTPPSSSTTPHGSTGWPRSGRRRRPGGRGPRAPGRYPLPLVLPTHQPALAALSDRALRERLFRASGSRGGRGDGNDTGDLVRRTPRCGPNGRGCSDTRTTPRGSIEVGTAETVEAVEKMLSALVGPAVRNTEAETAELTAVAGHPIEPWDRAFYAGEVRKGRGRPTPPPCARTSSWSGCCTTACSGPRASSTG